MVPKLIEQGHEVALSLYAGVFDDGQLWNGVPILTCGGRNYGNGAIANNYKRWGADCLISLCDAFCLEPGQLTDMNIMPWMPVDCEPLGEPDRIWLSMAEQAGAELNPVAMSRFGQRMFKEGVNVDVSYIPHAFDGQVYYHDPEQGRKWRDDVGIPQDMFLISLCGANQGKHDRKAFVPQLQAFRKFCDTHKDGAMYIHSDAQYDGGINLAKVALSLGLKHRVLFPDPERMLTGGYDETYMRGMYNASHVYTQTSRGEGFGVNVIEAMACGTPIVATRSSAQTELVPSGCGVLVGGDPEWSVIHNSWWRTPSVTEILQAYQRMHRSLQHNAHYYKNNCLKHVAQYELNQVAPLWKGGAV